MKDTIKRILNVLGLRNPAAGIKSSGERKIEILLSYRGGRNVFVETGINRADTTMAMRDRFKEVHSIELDPEKYQNAVAKFKDARHVHLYQGDSADMIYTVMERIHEPALIWLDAHGAPFDLDNSPVREELDAILNHKVKGHVIIIDDARHFKVSDLKEIRRTGEVHGYDFINEEGILRLTPKI